MTIVRNKAPAWKADAVVNEDFTTISSEDLKGKYYVLVFYPLDWTFVCPTEIIAFSERVAEFKALGAEVMAISEDSKHSHLAWIQAPRNRGGLGKMAIPVLADLSKSIARDFGVLVENPADPDFGIALRGTVIVDGAGTVRSISINDTAVGRSVDETLRVLQAFQYADKHGEVCPAGWKPGSKTMVADPHKSKAYFADVNAA